MVESVSVSHAQDRQGVCRVWNAEEVVNVFEADTLAPWVALELFKYGVAATNYTHVLLSPIPPGNNKKRRSCRCSWKKPEDIKKSSRLASHQPLNPE